MSPLGKERLEGLQRALAATCRAIAHHPPSTSVSAPAKRAVRPTAERQRSGTGKPATKRQDCSCHRRAARAARTWRDCAAKLTAHRCGCAITTPRCPRASRARRDRGGDLRTLEQVRVEALGARRMLGSPPISQALARPANARRAAPARNRPTSPPRSSCTGKPARLRPDRRAAGAARQLARLAGEPDRPGLERAARASGAAGGVRRARARAAGAARAGGGSG